MYSLHFYLSNKVCKKRNSKFDDLLWKQLQAFREMTSHRKTSIVEHSAASGKILNNYRPPLSKEQRVVSLGYL